MENTINLTEEQRENLVKVVQNLIKLFERAWKKVKEALIQLLNSFKEIISKNQKVKKIFSYICKNT